MASGTRAVVAANERRVTITMLASFALSMLAYGTSYLIEGGNLPARNAPNVARQLDLIGAALWLVMFVLILRSVLPRTSARHCTT